MELTKIQTNEREVEFELPDGTKTGFFLTLRFDSAEEVQRVYSSLREILQRGSGLATAFACYFTG